MRSIRVLAPALGGLVLSAPANADSDDYNFELTPFGAFRMGGEFDDDASLGTVELDDGAGFGLIASGPDTAVTQWEVYYSQQDTTADTSEVPELEPETDMNIQYLQLGGTYRWEGSRTMRPFLSAGIGATWMEPDASGLDSEAFWSVSIGTGMQFFTTERWGVRLEARAIGTFVDSDSKLFCVSSGGAVCAFALQGQVLWQVEALAGFTVRF